MQKTKASNSKSKAAYAEEARMRADDQRKVNWTRWGTYLPERQWGTVREDYSANGDYWSYLPHAHARSRAYRWGEDGLLGWCDRECRLCFGVALWNGKDPILKERLFGLTNHEGNHGEDVKECYWYLANTPTHSYAKSLYKYPQREFPYEQLAEESRQRDRTQKEYEILDTGIFDGRQYFDVFIEYAKAGPDDTCIRLTIANRHDQPAEIHVLPTVWFRNTWRGASGYERAWDRPMMDVAGERQIRCLHPSLGDFLFEAAEMTDQPGCPLFTENDSNNERLFQTPNFSPFVKDAFHDYVIHGRKDAVNRSGRGTKAAFYYKLVLQGGQSIQIDLRLRERTDHPAAAFGRAFDNVIDTRRQEADEFYSNVLPRGLGPEYSKIIRQAFASLLWTKQFYYYVVPDWLHGDPGQPPPPPGHEKTRNYDWLHIFDRNVLSMPDKWEYPWFAAWDTAFQMLPMSRIDPAFAKDQLTLLLREWFMHPNGQLPAYEGSFADVNPPVHAWACWRVYKICGAPQKRDREFLASTFQKLLMNFTWWVNRKDPTGNQIFSGGFLGMDNIGVFDRDKPLPSGQYLEQADGTAWMAFYSVTMMAIALELAPQDAAFEDTASKFFAHFVAIADAMNTLGGSGLWDEEDGFYYDQIMLGQESRRLKVRSLVGLLPLIAVEVLDDSAIQSLGGFRNRLKWFMDNRADLYKQISYMESHKVGGQTRRLLAIPSRERLVRVLRYMLDENEFLSPYGIRSLSKYHQEHPFTFDSNGEKYTICYEPAESRSDLFGGNSNWRGPIWMPINFLLLEALQRYHHFYGDTLKVECPTGSGRMMNLREVACEIAHRLCRIFLPDATGRRPWQGDVRSYIDDPHWKDLLCFHEYFHGDTGAGLGASHQTGWTALIVHLLETVAQERGCW